MQIKLNKIRWKNLMSFGNYWTEIQLDAHKTTLVIGKNGGGKCLRKSSKINITFDGADTEKVFGEFMESRRHSKSNIDYK